ncbi:MAG: SpoIIE family protein phosphatase [Acidobacteriota bacterium]
MVDNVLASIPRRGDEIPFALDRDGELRVTDPADAERLAGLPLDPRSPDTDPSIECAPPERHETVLDEWVIVTAEDKNCGVVFGIAQPIGDTMTAVRQNAVRNAIAGIGLVALALIGILPISRRVSRDFETLTVHADRIAAGDLETPVSTDRSCREAAMLAGAFNRMAGDLATHQDQLVTQETERRLLEAEYSRKSAELEQARTFQLSLLPRTLPDHPAFEIAVHMSTAAEVGGDYYDFRTASDGSLVAAIGDATGHGARAGTMVTALKSLFSAWNVDTEPASFLRDAHQVVRRMDLGRMTMAFTLARLEPRTLFVASAGMPPVLIHREGQVDEVLLPGMPLGGLASDYRTERIDLQIGDVILLLSDGFPELVDCDGNVLGYEDVRLAFAAAAADGASASEIVDALAASVHEHTRGEDPGDDVTFVAVRIVS